MNNNIVVIIIIVITSIITIIIIVCSHETDLGFDAERRAKCSNHSARMYVYYLSDCQVHNIIRRTRIRMFIKL